MKPKHDIHVSLVMPKSLKRELDKVKKREGNTSEAIRTAIRYWLDSLK